MLRSTLIAAAHSNVARTVAEHTPLMRPVVGRFVAGTTAAQAVDTAADIATDRLVSLDHLGEDTSDRGQAERAVQAYHTVLARLAEDGLANRVEVSVKLSALGQTLPGDGERVALENCRRICRAAENAGTTVTVDMEDHTTTDSTLSIVRDLRTDFPTTGAVLQAYLRRTESDCAELTGPGSRVRLCKGAYDEPESVAFTEKPEVDASYVRCLRVLMHGQGYPMIATHDPRLIAIAEHLAGRSGRTTADYEFQMLHGIARRTQRELAARGLRVRVYVPYGTEWFPYFMRRLGERPANIAFFARSLVGTS